MKSLRVARIGSTVYNPNVYEPSDDSFALVDALREQHKTWACNSPSICVEIGCGSGYVVCSVAMMLQDLGVSCACLATDLSDHALQATSETLRNHRLENAVDLVQTDLLTACHERLHRKVDLMLFNPPYVVTPDDEVKQGGIARAWAGGRNGRVVIDRLLKTIKHYLSPTGILFLVTVQDNDPQGILEMMEADHGIHGRIVLTRRADEELLSILMLSNQKLKHPHGVSELC